MQPALKTMLAAAALALAGSAQADTLRVGLAAPLDGPFALLGAQMRAGAEIGAADTGAELVVADDQCTAEGGEAAAQELAEAGVAVVVGFLCLEAIEAALPVFRQAGIAVVTPGVRANGLTDRRVRTGWLVWRLAPRADAEAAAIGAILPRQWRTEHFAIVDDGTIHGRELAESLRLAAEIAGLKPVFLDTYRPQMENQIGLVGRLARAGATHVFVGGDRDDIAIMARDAAQLGHALTFAGGEALRAPGDVPLAIGTLMIAPPEWADRIDGETARRFTEAGIVPEGYVLPAHAAVTVAIEALRRAQAEDLAPADILARERFETLVGPVSFDDKGDPARFPFILHRYVGERFLPAD
ncbi:MAG: branched-chain amino acid ABC transporter substrate-binding protein [Aquamicrobium sp.]|uniref:branched-chain amino acid ABC transporter substrate-binding protein n=1 Tax=Aquamicrobium sp. TaxID=1872579 RepID=UPI00349E7B8F|nr:branched-chain amino acid ABC transporter substrate-binding protein [Aquamicrobium sp.]